MLDHNGCDGIHCWFCCAQWVCDWARGRVWLPDVHLTWRGGIADGRTIRSKAWWSAAATAPISLPALPGTTRLFLASSIMKHHEGLGFVPIFWGEAALLLSCDLKSENSQVSLRVAELLTKSTYVRMDNNPDGEAAHVLKELQINAGVSARYGLAEPERNMKDEKDDRSASGAQKNGVKFAESQRESMSRLQRRVWPTNRI